MKENKKSVDQIKENKITRADALKKVGKYAAFTALATILILSPKASQAGSQTPENPGWD